MNKALGLHMTQVGREHVEPVVRFASADVIEALRPTHLTGGSLHAALNEARFVADAQIETDFTSQGPSMGLVSIGRIEKIGRGVNAANYARLRMLVGEPG